MLKYFIDMLPFPESFEHRPVCFVGLAVGMWGALRPVEHLQAIFGYRNAYVFPDPVFMPGINKLLDPTGHFISDDIPKRLGKQAAGIVDFWRNCVGRSCVEPTPDDMIGRSRLSPEHRQPPRAHRAKPALDALQKM